MKKIVVIGSSNVDTTLHVKDFPKPGETINALDVTTAGGGKGANQAIAAAKSGAETYFISRVGEDSAGGFITHQLKSYGVDATYVQTTMGSKTGHAYITLSEAGQNSIVIDHGANYELTVEDVKAASDLIQNWDCVIAQFETPIEVTLAAFKMAKKAGKITILNPAPAIDKIPAKLLGYTDIITPNETESAKITGIPIKNKSTLATNAEKLHLLGIKNVVITYGDKGAYVSTPDVEELVPAYKVEAADTTGAGDTFIGYLASNLNSDLTNFTEAAKTASRASSIAVQRLGAQPSIPTAKEVRDAMEEDE
ncbi:ribokinase [Lactobacillus kefiranofaciens]|uniref:Ribokinase n=1 Tax=Lactobacillus kefiranofaciens TaxID=267818 RepID=A0AAX3UDZ0_9LACO|nr:ribokinase [Lactobacillus kefiranofaciens]AEG40745.1 Ribokinase [Lactobacillus kefiranofaciens subsp. kefiranofaciens]MCJ2171826.1 ribokinase [Lactobacillus kefiranofaciens]MDF4142471.1 ribokinase [Lactobacillus kefiranofaciens]MDH5099857.1 ribokinase [Lactobacillus kefiranofaciens]PAK98796.1 ribokinase [Lactobacillus kefiranofaciens]